MQTSVEITAMEWRDDERLNSTDRGILQRLESGRETTGSLADHLEKHPQTIRDRLAWLREWGYVRYHHEPTGLHELESDGGRDVRDRVPDDADTDYSSADFEDAPE